MSDTGMQTIGAAAPVDLGAKRSVTTDHAVYTYQRPPGSGGAYITVVLGVDPDGDAPSASAYIHADDARCATLTADEFVTMLRGRFADLVAVLR